MIETHRCRGYPDGHECIVLTDSLFCSGCLRRRQEAMVVGLTSGLTPIGIVLEDFDAPRLACQCKGDPTAPDHEHSLLHRLWAWQQTTGKPPERALNELPLNEYRAAMFPDLPPRTPRL